nr:unnamed protein product [Digitaria exilis]
MPSSSTLRCRAPLLAEGPSRLPALEYGSCLKVAAPGEGGGAWRGRTGVAALGEDGREMAALGETIGGGGACEDGMSRYVSVPPPPPVATLLAGMDRREFEAWKLFVRGLPPLEVTSYGMRVLRQCRINLYALAEIMRVPELV